jgi:hypothetical protein
VSCARGVGLLDTTRRTVLSPDSQIDDRRIGTPVTAAVDALAAAIDRSRTRTTIEAPTTATTTGPADDAAVEEAVRRVNAAQHQDPLGRALIGGARRLARHINRVAAFDSPAIAGGGGGGGGEDGDHDDDDEKNDDTIDAATTQVDADSNLLIPIGALDFVTEQRGKDLLTLRGSKGLVRAPDAAWALATSGRVGAVIGAANARNASLRAAHSAQFDSSGRALIQCFNGARRTRVDKASKHGFAVSSGGYSSRQVGAYAHGLAIERRDAASPLRPSVDPSAATPTVHVVLADLMRRDATSTTPIDALLGPGLQQLKGCPGYFGEASFAFKEL